MAGWTGEAEVGTPFWWAALPEEAENDQLPKSCDLLVIGAGYAGLSAALAARACGAKVAVVDAGRPGFGASTRNGGMFGAHPRLSWDALSARFGTEVADAVFAEAKPAQEWVEALISNEKIDCDLQATGRLQLAWAPSHFAAQKRLAGHVASKAKVDIEVIEKADLGREIGTEQYFGGILFPAHRALHPAKFHNGLLKAVRAKRIPVVGYAEVTGVEREAKGFTVQTAKGRVRADKVVLCTNGYTTKIFRWHVARVFPLPSYIIATEELPENLIGHIAPGGRMMVETRTRHSYFRLSPDRRRVLFGGRASMRDLPLDEAARRMKETMCQVWPELAETRLSHIWTGNTGFSFNHMPHVGEHDGIHYAMGFCGSGTVMAPYLGAKAAYRAMGDARGRTAYDRTTFSRHFAHPFSKPYFLKAADIWYRQWVDRKENWQARTGR